MFLTEEERLSARPKIKVVRDFISAVNDNPFFHGLPREDLLEKMDDIASDVELAARKLSEMTGVDNTITNEAESANYLASGIIALSHINEETADATLAGTFMQYASAPYFKLRELENGERDNGYICPQTATEAMVGLASFHLLLKAVPAVYKQLSAPSPDGAVS